MLTLRAQELRQLSLCCLPYGNWQLHWGIVMPAVGTHNVQTHHWSTDVRPSLRPGKPVTPEDVDGTMLGGRPLSATWVTPVGAVTVPLPSHIGVTWGKIRKDQENPAHPHHQVPFAQGARQGIHYLHLFGYTYLVAKRISTAAALSQWLLHDPLHL